MRASPIIATLFGVIAFNHDVYALNLEKKEYVVESPDRYWDITVGASIGLPYLLGVETEVSRYHETKPHPYFKFEAGSAELLASGAASIGVALVADHYVHGLSLGFSEVHDRVNGARNNFNGTRLEYQIRKKPNNNDNTGSKFFIGFDYLPRSTIKNNVLGFLGTVLYFDFHAAP